MSSSTGGECARCGSNEFVQVVGLPGEPDEQLAPLCKPCRSRARESDGATRCGMNSCFRAAEYVLEHEMKGIIRVCGRHAANMVEAGVTSGVRRLV